MNVKLNVIKGTADGEQVSIDAEIGGLDISKPLLDQLHPYFELMDDRMLEMNKRIIASKWMAKRLAPNEQMHLHEVIEMLHGRKPASLVEQMYQEATEEVERQSSNAARKEKAALVAAGEATAKKSPQAKEGSNAGNGVTDINTKGKK